MSRMEIAEALAAKCEAKGVVAKIWTGGDVVRVYVRGNSDLGFFDVRADGSVGRDGLKASARSRGLHLLAHQWM